MIVSIALGMIFNNYFLQSRIGSTEIIPIRATLKKILIYRESLWKEQFNLFVSPKEIDF